MTNNHCLINQEACGREAGNPVCPKCGLDERVVYPGQAYREAAQERAELRHLRAHVNELQADAVKPAAPPPPVQGRAVGQVFRDAPWAPEMVVLPSGRFSIGSPADEPGRLDNEGPQHEVTIGYNVTMGRYPVTFEEWDACVADGGTQHKADDQGWGRGKRPVINVSWHQAQEYATWLNTKLGIAEDDPGRYRLPSESEWEYACRAGTKGLYSTPDGLMSAEWANYDASYTYGGAPTAGRKSDKTTPVGIYPANLWGLHDMHGNVWEWVQDGYEESYRGAPADGSAWESGSSRRVFRGGSWNNYPPDLRSANRYGDTPGNRVDDVGFRLARTVS
ncbi:MAG: formylglycine-generating enzyme family protein [Burkholderiales bacterium]